MVVGGGRTIRIDEAETISKIFEGIADLAPCRNPVHILRARRLAPRHGHGTIESLFRQGQWSIKYEIQAIAGPASFTYLETEDWGVVLRGRECFVTVPGIKNGQLDELPCPVVMQRASLGRFSQW